MVCIPRELARREYATPVVGSSSRVGDCASTRHAVVPFRAPYNLQTDCACIYRKGMDNVKRGSVRKMTR